jgi:ATP-binding cassette subfamily C protein CydD
MDQDAPARALPDPAPAAPPDVSMAATGTALTRLIARAAGARHLSIVLELGASLAVIPVAGLLAFALGGLVAGTSSDDIVLAVIVLAIVMLVRIVLTYGSARIAFRRSQSIRGDIRRRLVAATAARPLDHANPVSAGALASFVSEHVEAIGIYVERYTLARLRVAVVPTVIVLAVFGFSWVAALILIASGPIPPLFMTLIGWRAREESDRQLQSVAAMNAFFLDRLRGLATLVALGALPATRTAILGRAEATRRATMAVLRIAFLSSAVLELFAALGVALVAVYVGFNLLGYLTFGDYGTRLTLTEGLFILILAPEFFRPMRDFASAYHDRAAAEAAAAAIVPVIDAGPTVRSEIVDREPERDTSSASSRAPDPNFLLHVRGVTYEPGGRAGFLFHPVSFDARRGSLLAVVGPSGSGKTTLCLMLAGLVAPTSGQIVIGSAADMAPMSLKPNVTLVPQFPHLLHGSLAANLRLGCAEADIVRMREALKAAGALDLVDRLPAGLGTIIGETGLGLSGGEIRRIAIARALLRNTPILIVDEPTADLDQTTATEIVSSLRALTRSRLVIVASHDPAVAAAADMVVALERSAPMPMTQSIETWQSATRGPDVGAFEARRVP